jgi:hypothetical protein
VLKRTFVVTIFVLAVSFLPVRAAAQQMADPGFKAAVERPAYTQNHPRLVIDEAHDNFHTADGRYKPFADLLRSDGYEVVGGSKKFEPGSLAGVQVLVIANAQGPDASDDASSPAFTAAECDVVRDWVRSGGSLLLIADHTPFGAAAEPLAQRFGANLGKGFVFDRAHSEGNPTMLVFSRDNGLLGEHPLLEGRSPDEQVKRVVAFTGESLTLPPDAAALMKLGPGAQESPTRAETKKAVDAKEASQGAAHARPVGGRVQGLAMKFGQGRVAMFGEAAMFSAQLIRFQENGQQREFRMGMNVAGNDDRQLLLNVMHWLSGLLP